MLDKADGRDWTPEGALVLTAAARRGCVRLVLQR